MSPTATDFRRQVDHFETNSKVSTSYLSHFTDRFENLKEIIETGFRPSECDETKIYEQDYQELEVIRAWSSRFAGENTETEGNNETHEHKVPMVCFCDIPLKAITRHRKQYGPYSISLTKAWGIANGVSPMIYIPKDSDIHAIFRTIAAIKNRLSRTVSTEESGSIQMIQQLDKLFELVKPYQCSTTGYKFYDEREWRYTPTTAFPFNPEDTTQYLKFEKADIISITVRNTKEKNQLIGVLREKFGYISSKRIKIKK